MKRTLGKSVSVILVLACMLSAFCIGARAVEVEPCYTGIMSLSATLDIVLEDRRAAMGMFRLVVGTVLT